MIVMQMGKMESVPCRKEKSDAIVPREYQPDANASPFSFRNYYIQYGRFHMDET